MRAIHGLVNVIRSACSALLARVAWKLAAASEATADLSDAVAPPREWSPRLWDRNKDPRSDAEERHPEG